MTRVEVLVSGGDRRWRNEIYRMEAQAEIINAETDGQRDRAHDSMVELTTRQAIASGERYLAQVHPLNPLSWPTRWRLRRYRAELSGDRWEGLSF